MSEVFETDSARQTLALGRRLGRALAAGDCLALVGPLGSGKTVLAKGIAAGAGVEDERIVSSPTYVLVREYPGRFPVYHVDLYRLTDPSAEAAELGIEEMLADGAVVVEWADRAEGALPRPHRRIEIEVVGETARRFTVTRVE